MRGLGKVYYGDDVPDNHLSVHMWKFSSGSMKMIHIDKIKEMCEYLNCTPNELFGYETPVSTGLDNLNYHETMMIKRGLSVTRVKGGFIYDMDKEILFVPE